MPFRDRTARAAGGHEGHENRCSTGKTHHYSTSPPGPSQQRPARRSRAVSQHVARAQRTRQIRAATSDGTVLQPRAAALFVSNWESGRRAAKGEPPRQRASQKAAKQPAMTSSDQQQQNRGHRPAQTPDGTRGAAHTTHYTHHTPHRHPHEQYLRRVPLKLPFFSPSQFPPSLNAPSAPTTLLSN